MDLLGDAWENPDLIFPSQIGKPQNYRVFYYQFHKACDMAGVPRRRPHDMRHTFATLMLERDVNIKVLSEILGHASVEITLRVYAHITPRMRATVITELNAFLPPTEGTEIIDAK
jgi:integrase